MSTECGRGGMPSANDWAIALKVQNPSILVSSVTSSGVCIEPRVGRRLLTNLTKRTRRLPVENLGLVPE